MVEIDTLEMHTAGEPLRIVTGGAPGPQGATILERRRWLRDNADWFRTALMWEPRGHADMYGALIVPAERADSDFGVVFMHNEGYSTMCGHAVLALARAAFEEGWVGERRDEVRIDTPAGQVVARARFASGRYVHSSFRNVASFVDSLDRSIHVPGMGSVRYDLSFGGAFYAFVEADALGLELVPENAANLIAAGRAIKRAVRSEGEPEHPTEPDLSFLYGVVFTGAPSAEGRHSRHVCVFADGEVDRSPTGTGVSARAAILRSRGLLALGEWIEIESVLGTVFGVRALEEESAPRPAISPEVRGEAYVTGRAKHLLDPDDPLRHGFLVR